MPVQMKMEGRRIVEKRISPRSRKGGPNPNLDNEESSRSFREKGSRKSLEENTLGNHSTAGELMNPQRREKED